MNYSITAVWVTLIIAVKEDKFNWITILFPIFEKKNFKKQGKDKHFNLFIFYVKFYENYV